LSNSIKAKRRPKPFAINPNVRLNDPSRDRLKTNKLYVSKIFDWFEEDFNGDIVGFILKYAKGGLKKRLESNKGDIVIKYLDYDWSLNGK